MNSYKLYYPSCIKRWMKTKALRCNWWLKYCFGLTETHKEWEGEIWNFKASLWAGKTWGSCLSWDRVPVSLSLWDRKLLFQRPDRPHPVFSWARQNPQGFSWYYHFLGTAATVVNIQYLGNQWLDLIATWTHLELIAAPMRWYTILGPLTFCFVAQVSNRWGI